MKVRHIILIVSTLLLTNVLKSSAQEDYKFSNDSITYSLLKTPLIIQDDDSLTLSKYTVVTNLPLEIKERLKNAPGYYWLELLNSENSDWAANLVLYEIYQKDAFDFIKASNSKKSWGKCCRVNDIAYWKKILQKN